MMLELPIEEYFRYHPPTTPERMALHDRVNRDSLEICKAFEAAKNEAEVLAIRDAAILLAEEVCLDKTCLDWATDAIVDAACSAFADSNCRENRSTSILMHVQQFRMFLNQGITIDELKRQDLSPVLPEVVEEFNKSKDRFNISQRHFIERTLAIQKEFKRSFSPEICLTLDGNKWCALVGEDLQSGVGGFGDDPIAALSDLYANLKGIEFSELKNSSGEIYSTSIKSIAVDPKQIEKHQDFIDAYPKTGNSAPPSSDWEVL